MPRWQFLDTPEHGARIRDIAPGQIVFHGKRIDIATTRRLLDAALTGELEAGETRIEPLFGMEVPLSVAGVAQRQLDPRATWADAAAYDAAAARLKSLFAENFRKFDAVRVAAE